MVVFLKGLLYGSWTRNFPYDSPHACGTADAAGVAAGDNDACRSGRRGRILLLLADRVPISDIALTVGISRRFVYKWVQRFGQEGRRGCSTGPDGATGVGRPSLT